MHRRSPLPPSSASRPRSTRLLTLGWLGLLPFAACICQPPTTDAGVPDGGAECVLGEADCGCRSDDTCEQDLVCDNGTCETCTWGSRGCPCTAAGSCDNGDVCDDVGSECRAPTQCEFEGCAQHQLCDNPAGGDAVCLEECEGGYSWNAGTQSCDADPSCDPGDPGYVACDPGVACVDDANGVRCEGCLDGYVDVGGSCLPEDDCATFCGAGRDCVLGDGGATCGDCQTGYIYDSANDECVDRVTCDELSCGVDQICIAATPTTDAECRDAANCPTGQVDTGNGTCVPCVHCYDGANPLPGVTGIGNGGYSSGAICVCELEDNWFQSVDGEVKSCDADDDGWTNDDLLPVLQQNAGDNPFADEQRCHVREVTQFELVADVSTAAGVQATSTRVVPLSEVVSLYNLPGFAYQVDPAGRAYVRLFEPEILDVPELFELRYTSNDPRTRLRNYGGHDGSTLPPPTDADGGILDAGGPPDNGLTLHRLTPAEANPLTKWCNHDGDDLNLDSISDATQSQDVLPQDFGDTVLASTPLFYRMSYFLELNRGFWRDRTAECATNNEIPCHGAYVIREKARALGAADPEGLELGYVDRSENGLVADYWQDCARSRDPDYNGADQNNQPINMDFAAWHTDCTSTTGSCLVQTDVSGDGSLLTAPHVAYDGRVVRANAALVDRPVDLDSNGQPRWPGMNHHSQFKCVSGATNLPAAQAGRQVSGSYDLNDCRLEPRIVEGAASGADATNPRDPLLTCTQDENASVPNDGYNRWASLVLDPSVTGASTYAGGCAVEGAEWSHLCAASPPGGKPSAAVNNHDATYGQLFCVCGDFRTGAVCEVGCAPDLAVSDSFGAGSAVQIVGGDLVYARNWVCLHPSASYGTATGSDGSSSYTLTGEVPATAVPTQVVSGSNGTSTFTLSAPPVLP